MTWLDLPPGAGFGVANLPFGIFSRAPGPDECEPGVQRATPTPHSSARSGRVGVAIGDCVLDVAAVADDLRLPLRDMFSEPALNRFLAAGPAMWREARERLTEWLTLPAHRAVVEPRLVPRGEVRLHLPFAVADYVDFYASRNHAENVGRIFRPGQPPLPRNWLHMPLGYHGRTDGPKDGAASPGSQRWPPGRVTGVPEITTPPARPW